MGTISLQIPVIGQPDSTEDVKVQNNFTTIQNAINGNLDHNNLSSSAGIAFSQLQPGAWQTLTLTSGWGSSGPAAKGRIDGDVVRLWGNVQNNTGSTQLNPQVVPSLPSGLQQTGAARTMPGIMGSSGGTVTAVEISTTGTNLSVSASSPIPAGAIIYLDGVTWTTT